jgi:hypothetical protein
VQLCARRQIFFCYNFLQPPQRENSILGGKQRRFAARHLPERQFGKTIAGSEEAQFE